MTSPDLEQAVRAAWRELADAEVEHDQEHAARAVADLRRLEQLLPEPRKAS
jgi:hypothetical protein